MANRHIWIWVMPLDDGTTAYRLVGSGREWRDAAVGTTKGKYMRSICVATAQWDVVVTMGRPAGSGWIVLAEPPLTLLRD